MIIAGLVPDMRLLRIRNLLHGLTASRAIGVINLVVLFADVRVATVDKLGHPLIF